MNTELWLYAGVAVLVLLAIWFLLFRKKRRRYATDDSYPMEDTYVPSRQQRDDDDDLDLEYGEEFDELINPSRTSRPGASADRRRQPGSVVDGGSDDDFAGSFAVGVATGLPLGRNPAGALVGAMLHDDGSHHRSDDAPTKAGGYDSGHSNTPDRIDHGGYDSGNSGGYTGGDSGGGGDGGGGGGGD